jgi:hypothetical protein
MACRTSVAGAVALGCTGSGEQQVGGSQPTGPLSAAGSACFSVQGSTGCLDLLGWSGRSTPTGVCTSSPGSALDAQPKPALINLATGATVAVAAKGFCGGVLPR